MNQTEPQSEEKLKEDKPKIEVLDSPKHETSTDGGEKQVKEKDGMPEEKQENKQGKKGKHKNRKKKQKKDKEPGKANSDDSKTVVTKSERTMATPKAACEKSNNEKSEQKVEKVQANEKSASVVSENSSDSVVQPVGIKLYNLHLIIFIDILLLKYDNQIS